IHELVASSSAFVPWLSSSLFVKIRQGRSSPHGRKGGIVNLQQMLLGIAISSGLTLASVSQAQQNAYYFWRDARGNAHYSDVCPPDVECQVKRLHRGGEGTSATAPQPSSGRQGSSRSGVAIPSVAGNQPPGANSGGTSSLGGGGGGGGGSAGSQGGGSLATS